MNLSKRSKSKLKRSPRRGSYDMVKVAEILDRDFLCHVAINYDEYPISIPMIYGRKDNVIYLHGSSASRFMTQLEKGVDICLSTANVTGLVLARSAFNHSLNFESVVIFGKGTLAEEEEKEMALKCISDHTIAGRWEEVRPPSAAELKATMVIKVQIDEASAKVRTGHPKDAEQDYSLMVWAGTLAIEKTFLRPVADSKLDEHIEVSQSALDKAIENKYRIGKCYLRAASNQDTAAIQQIIFDVFKDYQITPNKEKYDRDLMNVEKSYFQQRGYFGLLIDHETNYVIGTIGLRELSAEVVELRRMYIQRDYRGKGLGNLIMTSSNSIAQELGYKKIFLETLFQFSEAISLYKKFGFNEAQSRHLYERVELSLELNI